VTSNFHKITTKEYAYLYSLNSKMEKLSQNQLDHCRCGCHYLDLKNIGCQVRIKISQGNSQGRTCLWSPCAEENLGQDHRRQGGCQRIVELQGHGASGCVDIIGS
jgi:hypothetical protein